MDAEFVPEDGGYFFPEESLEAWREYLEEFTRRMLPIFHSFGIDRNIALLAVLTHNNVVAILGEDEEEW